VFENLKSFSNFGECAFCVYSILYVVRESLVGKENGVQPGSGQQHSFAKSEGKPLSRRAPLPGCTLVREK